MTGPEAADGGQHRAPAGLLEKKRQTRFIFNIVMICMAGISLLVGGIAS